MARDYKKDWNEFWQGIVCNEDWIINLDQVKRELSDFSHVMENVPKVYSHVTGDTLSKVMYGSETVIRVAEQNEQERLEEYIEDELKPYKEEIKDLEALNRDLMRLLKDAYGIIDGVQWHDTNKHEKETLEKILNVIGDACPEEIE